MTSHGAMKPVLLTAVSAVNTTNAALCYYQTLNGDLQPCADSRASYAGKPPHACLGGRALHCVHATAVKIQRHTLLAEDHSLVDEMKSGPATQACTSSDE